LHSCWCISFGCWNSNSRFEFHLIQTLKPLPFSLSYPTHLAAQLQQQLAPRPGPRSLASGPARSAVGRDRLANPRAPALSAGPLGLFGPGQPASRRRYALPAAEADDRGPPVIPSITSSPGRTRLRVRPRRRPSPAGARPPAWPARQGRSPGLFKASRCPWTPYPRPPCPSRQASKRRRRRNPSSSPPPLISRLRRRPVVAKPSKTHAGW
jgi:hypothetical protein